MWINLQPSYTSSYSQHIHKPYITPTTTEYPRVFALRSTRGVTLCKWNKCKCILKNIHVRGARLNNIFSVSELLHVARGWFSMSRIEELVPQYLSVGKHSVWTDERVIKWLLWTVTGQCLKIVSLGTLMKSSKWQKSSWVCEVKGKADVTWQFLRELLLSHPELSKVSSRLFGSTHLCETLFLPFNKCKYRSRLTDAILKLFLGVQLWPPSGQMWLSCVSRGAVKCPARKSKSTERFNFSPVQGLNERNV